MAVRRDLISEIAYGGLSQCSEKTELAVGFYDLCLRLEEAALKRCGMDYGKMRQVVCRVDSILYHGKITAGSGEEETFTGAGPAFCAVREDALRRRGIRADLQYGPDPDLYHIVYDTSVSGRERCARAGSDGRAIAPHRVVSVIMRTKDAPDSLERCLKSFKKRTAYRYYEWIVVDNGSSEENRRKMENVYFVKKKILHGKGSKAGRAVTPNKFYKHIIKVKLQVAAVLVVLFVKRRRAFNHGLYSFFRYAVRHGFRRVNNFNR